MRAQGKASGIAGIFLGLLYAAAIAALFGACATAPTTRMERHLKDAETCLRVAGECTVIQVDNGGISPANLYINGGRFAYIGGFAHDTFYIPDTRLGGDGCVSIFIRLNPVGLRNQPDYWQTSKECVQKGDYFQLQIAAQLSTSFLAARRSR